MKNTAGTGLALCAVLLASNALADQGVMAGYMPGDIVARARVVDMNFDSSSSPAPGVTANDKAIPEVDVSYFFTSHIAAELILTYPQSVGIDVNGGNIGSVDALPPTLTLQYHFMPDSPYFRPYLGAGINYTNFSNDKLAGGAVTVSNSSWGAALQAGFDVPLSQNLLFNLDVKKIYMKTDASMNGAYLTTVTLDPVLLGVGLGWKF